MTSSQPNQARRTAFTTPLRLAFILCVFLTLALFACNPAPAITPTPTITAMPTIRPTNLGAASIKHEDFPSLSYGIQAFLWWNDYTRSRDLERVRQMRFQYVKQIIDWNALRAAPNAPYDWQHLDDLVNETQYRQLKLVARIGKPPYWAILPPTTDPNGSPIDLNAFGTFCHDLA